jgi:hypothetical protein
MGRTSRVTGRATNISTDELGFTNVRYHATDVVSFKQLARGIEVTLRTGGWRTSTTKTRMNPRAAKEALQWMDGSGAQNTVWQQWQRYRLHRVV